MTTSPRTRRAPAPVSPIPGLVTAVLDDMKAINVKVLDVRGLTDIADTMIIASGSSDRHVRAIADRVIERAKEAGFYRYLTKPVKVDELTRVLEELLAPYG